MTAMTVPAPVKGLVFKHARRTDWQGEPWVCTVTSVTPERVYWKHDLYSGRRFKTPARLWERMVAEVVSVPEPTTVHTEPKLSAAQCRALHVKAHAAGLAAGESARPTPMVVGSPSIPLGSDIDPSKPTWVVSEGACGLAWVTVRPGNSDFGRWSRRNLRSHKGHYGGEVIWVREFGQSVDRKTAYAQAYAEVLREAGVRAFAGSRLD